MDPRKSFLIVTEDPDATSKLVFFFRAAYQSDGFAVDSVDDLWRIGDKKIDGIIVVPSNGESCKEELFALRKRWQKEPILFVANSPDMLCTEIRRDLNTAVITRNFDREEFKDLFEVAIFGEKPGDLVSDS